MSKNSAISQSIQDAFVYLSITDSKFLQMARRSVKPQHFSSQVTEDLVDICYSYFDQFKEAPDKHFHDELVRSLQGKDEDSKRLYVDYLTRLQGIEQPNQAYVISRINTFVKAREFEKAAVKFVELTKEEKFDEAKALMIAALKVGIEKEEIGIKYLQVQTPSYYETENIGSYVMPFGIKTFDDSLPRGLRRTDFLCLLGGFKAGKSWYCTFLGKECLLNGLKVVHISHENSAEEVEMRYDMAIGGFKSYGDDPVQIETIDESGTLISTESTVIPSVFELEKVRSIRRRIAKFGGELIIRKYPMGRCSMNEMERYLDYLETYEGFVPDVVINDYIEKMKLPSGEGRRDGINEAYERSKGLADERKILMVTVSQVKREALEKRILNMQDWAEDIRKEGVVDAAFSVSRTRAQATANRMQMLMLVNRHGKMGFGCVIANNFEIGQFCVADWPLKMKEDKDDGKD